jgi:hypothetical protein
LTGVSNVSRAIGDAIEPQRARLIPMDAIAADVFLADRRAILNDVDQRHRVTPPQPEILLQPIDNDPGLDFRLIVALLAGQFDEFIGRLAWNDIAGLYFFFRGYNLSTM